MNEMAQQVFFGGVDPSDVRHQRGSFELKVREPQVEVREHDTVYGQNNEDRLNAWRAALTQVANLSGWDYNNYQDYSGVIEEIVNLKRRLWFNHHTIKTNAFVQCEKEELKSVECLQPASRCCKESDC